jgi:hypothetical protein
MPWIGKARELECLGVRHFGTSGAGCGAFRGKWGGRVAHPARADGGQRPSQPLRPADFTWGQLHGERTTRRRRAWQAPGLRTGSTGGWMLTGSTAGRVRAEGEDRTAALCGFRGRRRETCRYRWVGAGAAPGRRGRMAGTEYPTRRQYRHGQGAKEPLAWQHGLARCGRAGFACRRVRCGVLQGGLPRARFGRGARRVSIPGGERSSFPGSPSRGNSAPAQRCGRLPAESRHADYRITGP